MADASELLIKHGFKVESDGKVKADEENFEMFKGVKINTGYPKPICHFRCIWESQTVSMEEAYFWIVTSMRNDGSYNDIIKISDAFSASQSSSFFGATTARLGITQDRASGLLSQIGKLVKDLFQLVREIRVIKQKLEYYTNSYNGDEPAEVALKGIWVDQVEGGAKNPASVYGMASQVGFVTLPDLFFSYHPKKKEDVKALLEKLRKDFNRKVCEVLGRKLYAYLDWKEKTYDELKTRHKFTLKFLRQHFDVIRMYMAWVKPYLKYAKLLAMKPDRLESPELISAFEGSLLEVEVLGVRNFGFFKSVLSAQFVYRTTPTMPFHQDEYRHKGPLHVGKIEVNLRAYAWTQKQLDGYIKMRREEDIELLGSINDSIKAAMDALGSDLKEYLKEAGEEFGEDKKDQGSEKKKPKQPGGLDPFIAIFKGIGELGGAFLQSQKKAKKAPELHPLEKANSKSSAKKHAKAVAWNVYKYFKKAHGLVAW